MAQIVKKKKLEMFGEEDEPNGLGSETEANKHMKVILNKQLKTNVSLKEQFLQHRNFVSPSMQCSLQLSGSCSLPELKALQESKEEHEWLQRCGLNTKEIKLYNAYKFGMPHEKFTMNPTALKKTIDHIESKIAHHQEELSKPQTFSNVKKLTRQEMDIEKSLYFGCSKKLKLSSLVVDDADIIDSDLDNAYKHIQTLSNKINQECRNRKLVKKVLKSETSKSDLQCDLKFDCNIHHVNIPIPESEVLENRLNIEDILKNPRFANYKPGKPAVILYLKNLPTKVLIHEIRSLFGSFEEENNCPIEYKICTGRMKGQAFVKFSNIEVAEKALHFANGYLMKGKPIIIQFGKKT